LIEPIAAIVSRPRTFAGTTAHAQLASPAKSTPQSVVDSQLRVYGIQNLRIADGSIMPRVTTAT